MATREATWAYRDRHAERFGRTYFRRFGAGVVSSIGLGTYLGDPTGAVDARYRETATRALESGCNLLDTAINYRHQRSERAIGRAIADASVDRDAVVVATKGGFVPFDGTRPDAPGEYVRSTYVDPGLIDPGDLARGSHCIAPDFIDAMLDRSLENLGVGTIDLYYVHNPETQLAVRDPASVYGQLEATFERLEARIAAGELRHYGVATWDAFRVPPEHDRYLSLPAVIDRARRAADRAGRTATGFRAIQLPFNVGMADAFTVAAHDGPAGPQSALSFAADADLDVFTSASLGQGALLEPGAIPDAVDARLPGESAAQRAVNFARSAPGVTAALAGTTRPEHLAENVAAGTFDAMGAAAFDAVFE